ncbi:MAG: Wzz/FepE/Etk N-terminal domain-containing protein, partial [Marinoscillum sp.]
MTDQNISNQSSENDKDLLNSFDPDKFLYVLRKSIVWMLLFIGTGISLAFLYVRYTKPVYESESILKLEFQSEATDLGLGARIGNFEGLSGEIELLKSNLFFSKVLDAVDLDVTYNYYGRYLTDERYKNSPFQVTHLLKNKFDLSNSIS